MANDWGSNRVRDIVIWIERLAQVGICYLKTSAASEVPGRNRLRFLSAYSLDTRLYAPSALERCCCCNYSLFLAAKNGLMVRYRQGYKCSKSIPPRFLTERRERCNRGEIEKEEK